MKIAFLASSVLVIAACGGKSKPADSTGPDNGGGTPTGPIYAALFTEGASWRFDIHQEFSGENDMGEPETNTTDDVSTCSVTKVDEVQGVKVAEITCDDHWPGNGSDALAGLWAANDKGVWHISEWPEQDAAPQLDDAAMMFGVTPTAKKDHVEDPEMGESYFTDTTVEQKGDAWCWSELGAGGDEGWSSICLDASGPTEGTFGWAGGSVHDTKFTRAQ